MIITFKKKRETSQTGVLKNDKKNHFANKHNMPSKAWCMSKVLILKKYFTFYISETSEIFIRMILLLNNIVFCKETYLNIFS